MVTSVVTGEALQAVGVTCLLIYASVVAAVTTMATTMHRYQPEPPMVRKNNYLVLLYKLMGV